MPGTRLGTLLPELHRILPAESILTKEEQLRPYECDGLTAYRQIPMVVVLPDTTEQVQAILALCSRERVPVVARGAGPGSPAAPSLSPKACCSASRSSTASSRSIP